MATGTTIKLSILARRKRFPRLPGQPEGASFGILWDAGPIPADGVCYVVEFVDRSSARILGYVATGGRVFRRGEPGARASDPDELALALVRDEGAALGDVYVRRPGGRLERSTSFRGTLAGTLREVSDVTTWNTERSLVYHEFAATMFLRLCVFGMDAAAMQGAQAPAGGLERLAEPVEVFAGFGEMPLPDAIAALRYRCERAERLSGIEAFAYRVFSEVDLPRLREIAAKGALSLARIERMGGFYINFDRERTSPEDVAFLISVEAALNRVSCVLDKLGSGLAPVSTSPSEEACTAMELDALEGVTSAVDHLVHGMGRGEGDGRRPGTVVCRPGGEWDTRFAFAELCEGLNLIVRLEYRYDCDVAAGRMAVSLMKPPASAMPRRTWRPGTGWQEADGALRAAMAEEYGCRMGLVAAAAAFAASPLTERCLVEVRDAVDGSCTARAFDRAGFMAETVPLARELVGVPLGGRGGVTSLRAHETSERFDRIAPSGLLLPPGADGRPLPAELRDLLLADTVSELEVLEDPADPLMRRFNEVKELIASDPARAEAGLTELIEEGQASCVAAELTSAVPMQTQFCENHLGRIILPMLVDGAGVRIHRAPDALYFAQYELCNMYARAEAYERALPEARRLLDIASTSMQAHFTLVNVLARLGMYDEVVEVAKHGLRAACDREAAGYLYYRLAFALWNRGEKSGALACYSMVPSGDQVSAVAREEMRELMNEMGRTEPMGRAEVTGTLRACGIPVAPTDELYRRIADAAVLLADNGFLYLAARCAYGMWRLRGNDELGVVSRSLLG